MSGNEQSDAGGDAFQPPSPYDEPTGAFARPEISEADRDAFYERHRRRPGAVSRVDALDDLDPDEVATRRVSMPAATPRNPAPIPDVGEAATDAIPAQGPTDTAPTEAIPVTTAGRSESEPPTPIPSVEETFPELARTRADDDGAPTAKLGAATSAVGRGSSDAAADAADDADSTVAATAASSTRTRALLRRPEGAITDTGAHEVYDDDDDDVDATPAATAHVRAQRGTLDLGLLILRVGVGVIAVAHGLQKLFGWWGGPGLHGFAEMLAGGANPQIGFHSDLTWTLAIVGAVSETVVGVLLVLGLFTPIGASALLSVMALATTFRITMAGGFSFFAADSGVEYEVMLTLAAAALVLTGPGLYSLDYSRGWARRPFIGSVLWLVIGIAAAVAVWILCNGTNPLAPPGAR